MAKPLMLFENILDDTGSTLTVTTTPASGFPITNIYDWRVATAYRWKSGSLTVLQNIDIDLGDGITASPNTVALAGHNFGTESATYRVYHSDGGAYTAVTSAIAPTTDLPSLTTFTGSAHRYWRVAIGGETWTNAPQIGVLVLGRRLDFTEPTQFDLDPYGERAVVEDSANESGSWIGTNVRYTVKQFNLNYDEPGFTKTGFFAPAAGLGFDADFVPHAIRSAKPFFFNWNIDVDPTENYLCKVMNYDVRMPFVGSTARRSLFCSFEARREIT